MPKHTIFNDENYEIAYDDNTQKIYLDDKKHDRGDLFDNRVEISSPFSLTVAGKEVVLFTDSYTRQQSISYREKNGDRWEYGIYENGNFQAKHANDFPRDTFSWHDNRTKTVTDIPPDDLLTSNQRDALAACLIGDTQGVLVDLKQACTSQQEYKDCLLHLLQETEPPQLKLGATKTALEEVKRYFTPKELHRQALNKANFYNGHMLTLRDAHSYMLKILLAELDSIDPNSSNVALPALQQSEWDHLCWPAAAGNTPPIYERQSSDALLDVKKIIQAIESVYEFNSQPVRVKNQLELPALQTAAGCLNGLLNADYQSELANLTRPFLIAMSQQTSFQASAFNQLKDNFLLPLYRSVEEKIFQEKLNVGRPNPEQFRKLPVDYWDGVHRLATHADFTKKQFENPYAIFVIPDNFDDARLPPDKRHERQGRSGLAGPMAPVKTEQAPDGSPIYDLCTLGIPTGGTFSDNVDAAKKAVKTHFANLYAQIKQGRTIVVPYVTRGGESVPAFGNGVFVDSPLTSELRPFIMEEFKKLEAFCHGNRRVDELDEEYRRAWESNQMAQLPLPKISIPANEEPEQAGLLGKNLLNPGIRANFKEWLASRNLGELTENTDQNSVRTLTCTLSTGATATISNDGIVLNQAGAMSDEDFKKSMKEVIQLYISGYLPGEPPPAKALGDDKQKAIICQLLREANVQIVADTPKTSNTTNVSDPEQPPTSQLQPR